MNKRRDGEPFEEECPRLPAEMKKRFSEGKRLASVIRENLGRPANGR